MLDLKSTKFLEKDEIKKLAPSIFTNQSADTVSAKYTHIPVSDVIDDMALLGWGVVDAKEVKARVASSKGFQKHLLIFRNNDVKINSDKGDDDVFPQILLTNSHDGKNCFTFKCAIFRMVCENGLVVSAGEFSDLKLRHMGYTFEELQEKIKGVIEELPLTVETMNKMKKVKLNEQRAEEFAIKALSTRFDEEELTRITIDTKSLLEPTRPEDEENNLWNVFNIVQEKIIHGDFTYMYGVKIRKARKIKNFQQDVKVNEKLWELAESFI